MPEPIILTAPILQTLIALYPEGCEVVAGRTPDTVHAQALDGTKGCLVGSSLENDPTQAGCVGITRKTYFELPKGQNE